MYSWLYMSPSKNSGKELKFLRELSNLKQINHLVIPNDARLDSLKAFFILEQRNIYTCMVICPCDGTYNHLTYFKKNKSMRSKPQNIALAFDVLTPKLSCLIRFDQLIFQTNVVERVNSGQIVSWWHVPLIVHATIWKNWELRELSNLKQI